VLFGATGLQKAALNSLVLICECRGTVGGIVSANRGTLTQISIVRTTTCDALQRLPLATRQGTVIGDTSDPAAAITAQFQALLE